MEEVLGRDPGAVIDGLKRFLAGGPHYRFAHALFREVLTDRDRERHITGDDLRRWDEALTQWCARYIDAGIPDSIPDYVVEHAGAHLADDRRLFGLVSPRWRDVVIEREHSIAPFAADVARAAAAAARQTPPDVAEQFGCAVVLAGTQDRVSKIPPVVLGALARLGRLGRALGYASLIDDPETRCRAYVAIAEASGNMDAAARAVEAAYAVDRPAPRSEALAVAAMALDRADLAEEALEIARSLVDEGSRSNALATVASRLGRFDAANEASALADTLDNASLRLLVAYAAVEAWASQVPSVGALSLSHAEAPQRERFHRILLDSADLLANVTEEFWREGQPKHVGNGTTQIPQALDTSERTGEALLKILGSLAGMGWGEDALLRARRVELPRWRAEALISLAQTPELEQEALDEARRIAERGWRSQALARLARRSGRDALADEALEVARGIADGQDRSQTLGAVADILDRVAVAEEALETATTNDEPLPVTPRLVGALARAGLADEALAIARTIEVRGRNEALVEAAQAGLDVEHEALESAYAVPKAGERSVSLARVAALSGRADLAEEAVRLARTSGWWSLGRVAGILGRADIAEEVLDEARTEDSTNRAITAIYPVRALAECERVDQAVAWMLSIDNAVFQSFVMGAVAAALDRAGRAEEALRLARSISDPEHRSRALAEVATVMARADVATEALEAARAATRHAVREVLPAVVKAFARSGQFDEALRTARTIVKMKDRTDALVEVASAMARRGRVQEALGTIAALDKRAVLSLFESASDHLPDPPSIWRKLSATWPWA
jgi:tetratricopeptide (TPR) repeat protein